MADRPFIAVVRIVLTGSGQNTGEYDVGQGNTFTINRMQQRSTGAFDIIDVADSFGNRYTNASVSQPIDGQLISDVAVDNNCPADLVNPIVIKNNGRLQITALDTSTSANTVDIYLQGMLTN